MSQYDDVAGGAGDAGGEHSGQWPYEGDGEQPSGRHAREAQGVAGALGSGESATALVPAQEARVLPGTTLARGSDDLFENPGLPPHEPRRTDVDPRAARRAELQVAGMFGLATLLLVGFIAAFVAIDKADTITLPVLGKIGAQNAAFGVTLGGALSLIGAGVIHWARKLMSDVELVEERHPLRASDDKRDEAVAALNAGIEDSRIGRRPFLIGGSLLAALGGLLTAPLILFRDLGPLPEKKLRRTAWAEHSEIVYEDSGAPVNVGDLQVGSLVAARPNDVEDLDELAKASIFLIRLDPSEVQDTRQIELGHEGIYAFSRICPHVGCPVHLFEQASHHLLCPCHQSTFDMVDGAKVIFGPAARALPQLGITADDDGNLVADGDFDEPVGPSFWERG